MPRQPWLGPALLVAGLLALSGQAQAASSQDTAETIVPNDNTRPAGVVEGQTVTVRLRAATGRWQPEGPRGPVLTVDAFGEAGSTLTVPAPLIRVVEGATLVASLRNDLETPIRVHGLCTRAGGRCAPVDVPPRGEREVRFVSGRPGTYHYWATSMGAPMPFRELAGALVVDPAGGTVEPDRIFVITEWTSLTSAQLRDLLAADDANERFVSLSPRVTFVINGLSWPATERLRYRRGEKVRWRVINLSSQTHPMHLHGFYFTVLRTGDGWRDEPAGNGEGLRAVTQPLSSGGTALLEWTPEREGNWLFHCHVMHHVSPGRRLEPGADAGSHHAAHGANGGAAQPPEALGMAGMVLGITVLPPIGAAADVPARPAEPVRRLTMTIEGGRSTALMKGDAAVSWRLVAKDGGGARRRRPGRARKGEDCRRGDLRLRIRRAGRRHRVAGCANHGREVAGARTGGRAVVTRGRIAVSVRIAPATRPVTSVTGFR